MVYSTEKKQSPLKYRKSNDTFRWKYRIVLNISQKQSIIKNKTSHALPFIYSFSFLIRLKNRKDNLYLSISLSLSVSLSLSRVKREQMLKALLYRIELQSGPKSTNRAVVADIFSSNRSTLGLVTLDYSTETENIQCYRQVGKSDDSF